MQHYFSSDKQFLSLFAEKHTQINKIHYTPFEVAQKACEFLCIDKKKPNILDIGSGIGKFCFYGASHFPLYQFYGVEQRADLVQDALQVNKQLELTNIHFENQNIDKIDFKKYHHFYFFNSFYEHVDDEKLDHTIDFSESLYRYYNAHIHKQLFKMPIGTRVATFHSIDDIMPANYLLVATYFDDALRLFEKI